MQWDTMLYAASTWALPVVIAITLHEAAHGFIAHRLGDDTAYRLGRVTFNPLKHIDLFGTILMPGVLLLVRSPVLFATPNPCRSNSMPCAIRAAT
jgi:Zn-dependent protease